MTEYWCSWEEYAILKSMQDFEEMNRAYFEQLGHYRPARTVIGVNEHPKPGVLMTMNLTAVTKE